jgi:hypothetical protein
VHLLFVGGYVAALSSLAWTLASLSTAGVGVAARRRLIALAPLVSAAGMLGVAEGLSKSNFAADGSLLGNVWWRIRHDLAPSSVMSLK